MKRLFAIVAILAATLTPSLAQKIVIGSRVPDIRSEKQMEWLTPIPEKGRAMLIDFFSSDNPSCVKGYALLGTVAGKLGVNVTVVVLSASDSEQFRALAAADGGKYCFAIDEDDDIFNAFAVRYLPFYMLVNAKGEMVWQGDISNLDIQTVSESL